MTTTFRSSLSEALPAELAVDYGTPRKTIEDEHVTQALGVGYATLQAVQDAAVAAERMVAAAGRKMGLQQHRIDFTGRNTSVKGRKDIVGSVEMADATLTQSSARALMAGYVDSAASKQSAELRREFGSRIETLETGLPVSGATRPGIFPPACAGDAESLLLKYILFEAKLRARNPKESTPLNNIR